MTSNNHLDFVVINYFDIVTAMSEAVNVKRERSDSPPREEKRPRRSRFDSVVPTPAQVPPEPSSGGVASAAAIAAAKAMEITRALQGKLGGGPTIEEQREKALREAKAREIQAQIAAQMASVTNLLVRDLIYYFSFVFVLLF